MTEQPAHLPVDDLAAYAAGDLDATAAVSVEAHVLLCGDCAADLSALRSTAADLAALPPLVMPAEVAERLDAAIAGARTSDTNVVPLAPRRRRPSFAGIAAAAAAIALAGAVGASIFSTAAKKPSPTAAKDLQESTTTTTRRLESGLTYTREGLSTTLAQALAGVSVADSALAPAAPSPTAQRNSLTGGQAPPAATAARAYSALQTDAGRYAACIAALAAGQPEVARVPAIVDFARFGSAPAIIVAFPTFSGGRVRADRIDVFVAGPGCGTVPGGDVLDFQRIPRPTP